MRESKSPTKTMEINRLYELGTLESRTIIRSPRRLLGPFINFYKRVVNTFVYPALSFIVNRQSAYNHLILSELNSCLTSIRAEIKSLEVNFLEQNHWRMIENKTLRADYQTQNHARFTAQLELQQHLKNVEDRTRLDLFQLQEEVKSLRLSIINLQNQFDYLQKEMLLRSELYETRINQIQLLNSEITKHMRPTLSCNDRLQCVHRHEDAHTTLRVTHNAQSISKLDE